VVDAPDRRVHEMHAMTISMYTSDLKNRILEIVTEDQHYGHVKESLQQSNVQQKFKAYKLEEDEITLYMNKLYFPNSQYLRNFILKEMQNVPCAGYLGYHKTIAIVRG
jgi:hypothetical protein